MLAPQLIQSLRLLQMPALQLEQEIRHQLETNPLLEEVEELEPNLEVDSDTEAEVDESVDTDWDEFLFDDEEGYKVRQPREEREDHFEGTASRAETLYDYLTEQLAFLKLSAEQRLIGEYIIGNIAPNGYLTITVDEMAEELQIPSEEVAAVLELIQGFDPPGIAARDLRESLLIQLRHKGMADTLAYRLVSEHLKVLGRKSVMQLSRMMGVTPERAQAAMETIKNLSPTPVQGRFDPGATPVIPDLVVERIGDEFHVIHNDSHVPQLRINSSYRSLMRRGSGSDKETKEYVKQKLDQAKWLLNSINQRRSTMVRAMEAIVERQREWFEHGPAYLKPLRMEDIAQAVDMNVATISRVSKGKYVQTPHGVYEIRSFFNQGVARDDGADMSKHSVKQRIQELIDAEPDDKPHSDQEIYRRLNAEGIKLARRTVTKYREELGIPAARLRKRVTK
jgi:RNA polymerase sigma-54 factor